MELRTERLLLREFLPADFAAVHDFAANPATTEFLEWGPNTEQDTTEFLDFCLSHAATIPRTAYLLAITQINGPLFGTIGLTVRGHEAEIGYTLNPAFWGRGYATEAATALLDFGLANLGLDRVTATCRPENTASACVLQKLGMTQCGRIENDRLIRGSWLDTLVFAIDAQHPAKSRPSGHMKFTAS